jgi:hypothetical protein
MSLLPHDDVLAQSIESWRGFKDLLNAKRKEKFAAMFNRCYKDLAAINAKGEPFANEPVFMALLIHQKEMIDWLVPELAKVIAINAELEAKLAELKRGKTT